MFMRILDLRAVVMARIEELQHELDGKSIGLNEREELTQTLTDSEQN